MTLVEYRHYSYMGDIIMKLAISEMLHIDKGTKLVDKFHRREINGRITDLTSNAYLSKQAQAFGMIPHPDDQETKAYHWPQDGQRYSRRFANMYECFIYHLYLTGGMKKVKKFINRTLIQPDLTKKQWIDKKLKTMAF